jgi:hypothetical protein
MQEAVAALRQQHEALEGQEAVVPGHNRQEASPV